MMSTCSLLRPTLRSTLNLALLPGLLSLGLAARAAGAATAPMSAAAAVPPSAVAAAASGNPRTGGFISPLGLRPRGFRNGFDAAAAACPLSNLTYHSSGPVILAPKVVDIFWGPTFNDSSSPDYQYARTLLGFRDLYGGAPEFNVITQYYQNLGSGNQFIQLANLAAGTADWFDTSTPPANVTDADVQAEVQQYLTSHSVDYSTIYEVFIPSASYSSNGTATSCGGPNLSYCAYHGSYGTSPTAVKYSIQPYPNCGGCQVAGWTTAENQEHFISHETREAVTDPLLNAWYNSCSGDEADDQCAWSPTPFLGSGGYGYQYEWSNAASGCVQTAGGFGSVGNAVDSASYVAVVSPDGIATLFGQNLASTTASTSGSSLPTTLGGVNVTVDGLAAGLSYVSPTQINLVLPSSVPAPASELLFSYNNGTLAASGAALIQAVAPGLFSANGSGSGLAAGDWQRYTSSGQLLASNSLSVPIDFGNPTDQVYLILFGTGIRHVSSMSAVSVTVGGQAGQVTYAGAQGSYQGLDQVNVLLPHSLAGSGSVPVALTAAGVAANTVTVDIQ
ncbi:MAG TPA: hypothetical protein VKY89_07460 [Thermoanaerobaculia bacterium]|nr:hypothetical protein [Thermoanaerobaculia bacterium]